MKSPQTDFFPPRPASKPMVYAYSEPAYPGLLKVGYTAKQRVEDRVRQQFPTLKPTEHPYVITVAESAEGYNGANFTDKDVHQYLRAQGFKNPNGEWFECTKDDVEAAILAVKTGNINVEHRTEDFNLRPEQTDAVERTAYYFEAEKMVNPGKTPQYLWNAKMRFGKTFATYQLAKKMGLHKLLVITFKPAVQASWKEDLNSHIDFEGWQFVSVKDSDVVSQIDNTKPLVAFGSFQDLLGKNPLGGIKTKNEWIHAMNWDLIVFDEYHFGAWREAAKGLTDADEDNEKDMTKEMDLLDENILPITTDYKLYLSGTPFRAIATGEFVEDQIFNWTYSDEQQAKEDWNEPGELNPYAALPRMVMMTYQMPESVTQVALGGEYDEFDLGEFFRAEGDGKDARFKHASEVQRWLDILRQKAEISTVEQLKMGAERPPLPYADTRLLPLISHSLWYLPRVNSCYAMANLLNERQNNFYQDYKIIVAAGTQAGVGVDALRPVEEAMGDPLKTKSITLTCGKLTTGVTVRPWTAIFMLRNLVSPESYFQAAFRVQSPWVIKSEDATKPDEIIKRECYVFDFAPNRALRQIFDYSCELNVQETNTEHKVSEFIKFLPVLAFDGSHMMRLNAGALMDMALSGTTANLLARKWESALLVNVDNFTLKKIMDNQAALDAIFKIEGFRSLGDNILETIVNKSEKIKDAKSIDDELSKDDKKKAKKELSKEEKELKSLRKQVQEKLIKFATRIPIFMYLTDFREQTLKDVITQLEPGLFKKVTGLEVEDFNLLVQLGVFNAPQMNDAVYKFRRYEDSSLTYAGIDRHEGEKVGGWDTQMTMEEFLLTQ